MITFRASSSGDLASVTATTTITKPAGAASNDILVVAFGTDKASNVAHTITPSSGWSRIAAQVSQTNGASQIVLHDGFWSLGSNTNLGFTNSVTGTIQQGWVCGAFPGVDNTNPIDVQNATGEKNTAAATLSLATLTTVRDQSLPCVLCADWSGGVFSATGYNVAENGHTNASAALLYATTPLGALTAMGALTLTNTLGTSAQILTAIRFALRAAVGTTPPFVRSTSIFRSRFI
jgi:hypothetical protein